jgi:hypothetical protein
MRAVTRVGFGAESAEVTERRSKGLHGGTEISHRPGCAPGFPLRAFVHLDYCGRRLIGPLGGVKRFSSEVALGERATRTGFQIAFEGKCTFFAGTLDGDVDVPGDDCVRYGGSGRHCDRQGEQARHG